MKRFCFRVLAAAALLALSPGCSSEEDAPPPQPKFPEVKVDITDVTVGYLRTTAEPNAKVSRYALILAAQNVWEMQLETHGTEAKSASTPRQSNGCSSRSTVRSTSTTGSSAP